MGNTVFNCPNGDWTSCIWRYSFWANDHFYSLLAMGGDPNTITISGFQSGSSMATNMHVIYSNWIKGAGLVAGGPFGPYENITFDKD